MTYKKYWQQPDNAQKQAKREVNKIFARLPMEFQQAIAIIPPNGEYLSPKKVQRLRTKIEVWQEQNYWQPARPTGGSAELQQRSEVVHNAHHRVNANTAFELLLFAILVQQYSYLGENLQPIYENVFRKKFQQLTGEDFPQDENLPYNWQTPLPNGRTMLQMLHIEAAYRAARQAKIIRGLYDENFEDCEEEFLIMQELQRSNSALLAPSKTGGWHGILDKIMAFCIGFAVVYSLAKQYFKKYKFHAKIDQYTTETCLSLDGMIFRGNEAVLGVNVPPIVEPPHPCRSWIEVYDKNNENNFDKSENHGIIESSGGRRAKTRQEKETHAEMFYESVRKRPHDYKRIAANTPFTEQAMYEIKQHMFFREHDLGGGDVGRFDPDFEQALAWQRLTQGNHNELDLMMLRHEFVELTQMRLHGYDYATAHIISNRYHDWDAELRKLGR
ncbi:MAG: hypothetical protein FWG64_13010 [Firmicutes bacterium]|nr:hypothetical protein [Bacillota bacterium]